MKSFISGKNRVFLISFFFLFFISLFLTPTLSIAAGENPMGVHLTWDRNAVHTSMTISWETVSKNGESKVFYDNESGGENPAKYEYSVEGHQEELIGEDEEVVGYAHHVTLTNLSPNESYYFVCGSQKNNYSEEFKFKTLPRHPEKLKFVVLGDTRPGALDFPEGRNNVAKGAASHDPSFIIHTGDHIEHALSGEEWQEYFNYIQNLWVDSDGYLIPIIPVIGNHEVGTDDEFEKSKKDARLYYSYFGLPGNERWFTLDLAPFLKFIGLDSETYTGPDSEQYKWLANELEDSKEVTWKFSAYHRPSFGEGYGGEGSSSKFLPLLEKSHVDFSAEGHVHMYTRSQPLNTSISTGKYFPYDKGTVHIVAGGGGAPLYSEFPAWWHAAGPITKYSYVVFEISESSAKMETFDTSGEVIDKAEIHKELTKPKTVVELKETGYADDNSGPPPYIEFGQGTKAPVMKVSKVGEGMVAAAGLAWSSVNDGWRSGELDTLYAETLKQMTAKDKNVLWYEGYNATYTTDKCSQLIEALEDRGYSVTGNDTEPITKELLSDYDILVIPQLALGSPFKGGNPDKLPWSDVQAIEQFVRSGNGLLVMDAHDYGGHNWARVQNKILAGIGADMTLQSDGIYDWENNWSRGWFPLGEVTTATTIGRNYREVKGNADIGLFEVSSVINNPSLYLEKIPSGARSVINGRKSKADTRVLIETKEGGSGYVRIQKTPSLSNSETTGGVHEPLVEVSIQSEIPTDKIVWPVTIEMYYSQDAFENSDLAVENDLEMYYWDTEQGAWRRCQEVGVNADRNAVVGSIYHFTKFAIMSDPR